MEFMVTLDNGSKLLLRGVIKMTPVGQKRPTGRGKQKLNFQLAEQIRQQYARGNVDRRVLAKEHGVSVKTIEHVIYGNTWNKP